jgi:hypothetical protein
VKIPGFLNLREFAEVPEVQTYLKDKVSQSWADNAMTFSGASFVGRSSMNKNENLNFIKNVVEKN